MKNEAATTKGTEQNSPAATATATATAPADTNVKVAPKLTKEQETKVRGMETKSAQIRYLDSEKYSRADIARILTGVHYPKGEKKVLYQHVRNVLLQPAKAE